MCNMQKEFLDIVERLEENSFDMSLENPDCKAIWIDKAIKIVNQVAQTYEQEVCEWKTNYFHLGGWEYQTECGERTRENTDFYKYCPYCGKKIKVVE